MHSEQYSSFLALSSSVSGFDGLLEAEALEPAKTSCPGPTCSEPLLLLHPGEVEDGGGVGVGMRHTEGTGESMGGVGGVVRGGRGPGASRGPFDWDRGCGSSTKRKKDGSECSECSKIYCLKEQNIKFESQTTHTTPPSSTSRSVGHTVTGGF